jgi:hypothetical protein
MNLITGREPFSYSFAPLKTHKNLYPLNGRVSFFPLIENSLLFHDSRRLFRGGNFFYYENFYYSSLKLRLSRENVIKKEFQTQCGTRIQSIMRKIERKFLGCEFYGR